MHVQDLVQQQFPRSCYGTAYPVGRVTDPSMMLGLMNLGDEVVSRSDTAKDAQPESSGAHSRLTGSVVEVAQAAPDRQPMYTVRCASIPCTVPRLAAGPIVPRRLCRLPLVKSLDVQVARRDADEGAIRGAGSS